MRCTSTTSRKSSMLPLLKLLSRRIPALLTRMSIRPHWSMVWATMAFTSSSFATLAPLAIASPPAASISATTARAASLEPPVPSLLLPRSLTTTFAPRFASSIAWQRPRPWPAPVTIATLPSYRIVIVASSCSLTPASGAYHHGEPFCRQGRRILALNLHGHARLDQEAIVILLRDIENLGVDPHTLARTDRSEKSHLVETIIDAHHHVLRKHALFLAQFDQQGQREETVGNRASEGRLRRTLLIDVNKLVILRAVCKGVDTCLVYGDPGAGRKLHALLLEHVSLGHCR